MPIAVIVAVAVLGAVLYSSGHDRGKILLACLATAVLAVGIPVITSLVQMIPGV